MREPPLHPQTDGPVFIGPQSIAAAKKEGWSFIAEQSEEKKCKNTFYLLSFFILFFLLYNRRKLQNHQIIAAIYRRYLLF